MTGFALCIYLCCFKRTRIREHNNITFGYAQPIIHAPHMGPYPSSFPLRADPVIYTRTAHQPIVVMQQNPNQFNKPDTDQALRVNDCPPTYEEVITQNSK